MLCEVFAVCVACAEYRALLQHQMQPAITVVSASVGQTPNDITVHVNRSSWKKRKCVFCNLGADESQDPKENS